MHIGRERTTQDGFYITTCITLLDALESRIGMVMTTVFKLLVLPFTGAPSRKYFADNAGKMQTIIGNLSLKLLIVLGSIGLGVSTGHPQGAAAISVFVPVFTLILVYWPANMNTSDPSAP